MHVLHNAVANHHSTSQTWWPCLACAEIQDSEIHMGLLRFCERQLLVRSQALYIRHEGNFGNLSRCEQAFSCLSATHVPFCSYIADDTPIFRPKASTILSLSLTFTHSTLVCLAPRMTYDVMFRTPFLLTSPKLRRRESGESGRPLMCCMRLAFAASASVMI